MKNITKKLTLILILLSLSNCGLLNSFVLIGYNFTAISPHSHRVTKKIEESFPENGKSIVSLNFKLDEKNGTNTVWRKMNNDGTFGKRITLTYIEMFKRGRVRVALDPGTYVMDGIRFPNPYNNRYYNAGAFNKFYSTKQMGWDEEKQKPIWFSFEAEAGKEVFIPDVMVDARRCDNSIEEKCIGTKNILIMAPLAENPDIKTAKYQIGFQVDAR